MNKIDICPVCKLPHELVDDSVFPKAEEIENFCSDCKVDEALHAYLRSLRQMHGKLSLSEKFFLFIKG